MNIMISYSFHKKDELRRRLLFEGAREKGLYNYCKFQEDGLEINCPEENIDRLLDLVYSVDKNAQRQKRG